MRADDPQPRFEEWALETLDELEGDFSGNDDDVEPDFVSEHGSNSETEIAYEQDGEDQNGEEEGENIADDETELSMTSSTPPPFGILRSLEHKLSQFPLEIIQDNFTAPQLLSFEFPPETRPHGGLWISGWRQLDMLVDFA
ncbi:unnamed protein product [Psylliodes chrysocephalus]|uniref:Uncharacterized protein n=1 Tax=Psylliodes chrysocephalus TaxID=3402493 RepID=A0A9P0GME0_9CUCU|nr:unnamed protein product [Psylliodes chrysocephala]